MTEDRFLRELFSTLPGPSWDVAVPPGDDCAAVAAGDGKLLLLAVDQLVGDRHYHATGACPTPPERAGRKLLARNLSDIAAMGGSPRYALVAVAFGPHRTPEWLAPFFAGISVLAREYGVGLIGGDLAKTPSDDVASLTIVGEVHSDNVCRRSGARAGDLLFVTGRLGNSLATGHHLDFTPRCHEGQWLADNAIPSAMIDISDGFLLDVHRMSQASDVGVQIDTARLPRRTTATTLKAALTDGEDYELLFGVPRTEKKRLLAAWPFPDTLLTCVGTFAGPAGKMADRNGEELEAQAQAGFDHFLG